MKQGTSSILAGMLAAACIAIAPASASAAPQVDEIFDLTGQPQYLAEAADGTIWMTLSGSSANNDMARITLNGVVNEFDVPNVSNAKGITSGPDGNLWVTQANEVVRVPPTQPALATQFTVGALADPRAITTGPDGNLWTASNDKVVRIPPADPTTFTEFTVAGLSARGISANDSLVWVADSSGRVISLNTAGAGQTPYDVGGMVQEVAASTGTDQVAYANPGANPQTIGRITPPGPAQTSPTPMKDPFGVTLGGDGAWWYAQFASSNLGRLTPNGTYTELGGLPANSGPRYLTSGPNGTLWVGLQTTNQVALVTGVKADDPPPAGAPQTNIDKAPKKVKPGKKGAKAKFEFSSPTASATFECALKRKGKKNGKEKKLAEFATCSSPQKYKKLRKGTYTFEVRARAGGKTDPTPAEAKLKVKKKKSGKG